MTESPSLLTKYEDFFLERGLSLELMGHSDVELSRLIVFFKRMNSVYVPSMDSKVDIGDYSNKLIKRAYNFVVSDSNRDVSLLSIYADDFITKSSYITSIGVSPEYFGRNIAKKLIRLAIEFSESRGFCFVKLEVSKRNLRAISLYLKMGFFLENENAESEFMSYSI